MTKTELTSCIPEGEWLKVLGTITPRRGSRGSRLIVGASKLDGCWKDRGVGSRRRTWNRHPGPVAGGLWAKKCMELEAWGERQFRVKRR